MLALTGEYFSSCEFERPISTSVLLTPNHIYTPKVLYKQHTKEKCKIT